jgi:hypothetical protein
MLPGSASICDHVALPDDPAVLCRKAEERLRVTGYIALRDVRCELHQGVLRIHGRLRSHHLKQVAQAIVATVAGKTRLENCIEIVGQAPRHSQSATLRDDRLHGIERA